MANVSMIEDRAALPSNASVNANALIRNFFQEKMYTHLNLSSEFHVYARLYKFTKRIVCDVLVIVHTRDLESAERLESRLDSECSRIRRIILQGKAVFGSVIVRKHHFMTVKKELTRYSYWFSDFPVGFLIRPLIFIDEPDQWEYICGPTRRIDILSLDSQNLSFYFEHHKEDLKSNKEKFVDLKKYKYWKIANRLIDYGHIPLLILWILKLAFSLFQVPFLLEIGEMILYSLLLYGSFIGYAYIAYRIFYGIQINELQEFAMFTNNPRDNYSDTVPESQIDDVDVLNASRPITETSISETESRPSESLGLVEVPLLTDVAQTNLSATSKTAIHHSNFYKTRIRRGIHKVLKASDQKSIIEHSNQLMRNILCWISAKSDRNIPRHIDLLDLLKLVKNDQKIKKWFRSIRLWASKLGTVTPFDHNEMKSVKKFFLLFLFDLKLLPPALKRVVVEKNRVVFNVQSSPIPNVLSEPNSQIEESNSPILASSEESASESASEPQAEIKPVEDIITPPIESLEILKEPPPNIEVDSRAQVFYTELAGIDEISLKKIQESELNGDYCIVVVNGQESNVPEIIAQFNASTKDIDVTVRKYFDINGLTDPIIERQFCEVNLPAVMVGCGKRYQVTPYGKREDDVNLHAIIKDFLPSLRSRDSPVEVANLPPLDSNNSTGCEISLLDKNEGTVDSFKDASVDKTSGIPVAPSPPPLPEMPKPPKIPTPPISPIREKRLDSIQSASQPLINVKISQRVFLEENLRNFQEKSILVDGSNVAYLLSDKLREAPKKPRLACVRGVLKTLRRIGIPQQKIMVFFDANIEHKLDEEDRKQFLVLIENERFECSPAGSKADSAMIQWAEALNREFIVISKDNYRKEPEWFRLHRIGAMLGPANQPLLIFDSIKTLISAYYGELGNNEENKLMED